MRIRKARKEDLINLVNLEFKVGFFKTKKELIDFFEQLFQNLNEFIYVAEITGKIVGYRSFEKKGIVAEPGFLSVSKKFQGKGIGASLMKKSIIEAKKLGCVKMKLSVRNNNFIAIGLYNKLSFEVIEVVNKKGNLKLIMEKKLK